MNFKIISLYPKTNNPHDAMHIATVKAHQIARDMVHYGVSLSRISIDYQENEQVDYQEIYLYATI